MGVDDHNFVTSYIIVEKGCTKLQTCSECEYIKISAVEPHQYIDDSAKCNSCGHIRPCRHAKFETLKNGDFLLFPCSDDPTSCCKREQCDSCKIHVVSNLQTHIWTKIRDGSSKYFYLDNKMCVKREMCYNCGLVRNMIEDKLPCLTCDLEINLSKFDPELDHPTFKDGVCTDCKTKCDHRTQDFYDPFSHTVDTLDPNKCGIYANYSICPICREIVRFDSTPHLFLDREKDGRYDRSCIKCGTTRPYSGNLEVLEQKIEKALEKGKQELLSLVSDTFRQLEKHYF